MAAVGRRQRRVQGSGSVYWDAGRERWRGYVELDPALDGLQALKRPRRYVSARTEAAAERLIRDLLAERDAGRLNSTGTPTVAGWMATYLAEVAAVDVGPRTLTRYRELVELHIVPVLGSTRLEQLTPRQVAQLHRTMRAAGLAPATIRQAHAVLARALRIAQAWGLVGRNAAALAGGPSVTAEQVQPLSTVEARAVVAAAAGDRMAARWLLGLGAGLRQGEVLGLEWGDLVLEDSPIGLATLTVRSNLQWVRAHHGCGQRPSGGGWPCGSRQPIRCPQALGEGDLAPGLHLLAPKTKTSADTIAIPDEVRAALLVWRDQQARERREEGPRWTGWEYAGSRRDLVFTTRQGRPVRAKADWTAWQALLASAGLAPARLHALRHTTATELLLAGVDIRVVQQLLRHASPDFTRRVYQHVNVELEERAARALGRRLFALDDLPSPAPAGTTGVVVDLADRLARRRPADAG